MNDWNDLFVATAGAAAALTGLLFVSISINLKEILKSPLLPKRASVSLVLTMSILVFSVVLLIPDHGAINRWVMVALSVLLWLITTRIDISIYRITHPKYKRDSLLNGWVDQLVILPYLIGSILMLFSGEAGLYWIAAAFVLSFLKSVWDAWILLIEILR